MDDLRALPDGEPLLTAARAGDAAEVQRLFAELSQREVLPARLHHHLAVLTTRAAGQAEEAPDHAAAAELWRRAWRHWLVVLADADTGPAAGPRNALLDHLTGRLRRRINDLLRSGDVDSARRYSELVRKLPGAASPSQPALVEDLTARVERFRDELATEHLLATREAMRYGSVPEGWRADYERGLTQLRRLMALDRDNVRLLTAVIETCADWFLDLYNAQDWPRLKQEVERYTPMATHLVRLTAGQQAASDQHPARPALSEFYKFRGFVEPDTASRVALYREALRLSPANENVRELLAGLGVKDIEDETEGESDE